MGLAGGNHRASLMLPLPGQITTPLSAGQCGALQNGRDHEPEGRYPRVFWVTLNPLHVWAGRGVEGSAHTAQLKPGSGFKPPGREDAARREGSLVLSLSNQGVNQV